MNVKSPIAVKVVIMHMKPHLDEICAYLLLRMYGESLFPGITKAPIQYCQGDIKGDDASYDRDGYLPIGVGHGRFDEHKGDGERLPNECATTLVAKYLGIEKSPQLVRLIAEVLECDSQGHCSPTKLAELVKVSNRWHKDGGSLTLNWVIRAHDAIIFREKYNFAPVVGEKSLLEIFKGLIDRGSYGDNPKVREYLFRQIHESMRDESCTSMASIVKSLFRRGYKPEDVVDWVDFALHAMSADQENFQRYVDILKTVRPIDITFRLDRSSAERCLKLLVYNGDDSQIPKAARYVGADLIIMRNSSGNVQIFTGNNVNGLSLTNVARMVRWLELPMNEKNTEWKSLGHPGKYSNDDKWYYFDRGEMLLNGSETHKVLPTKISNQALIDVLQHAFFYEGIKFWCNQRGIRINGKGPDQENATEALFDSPAVPNVVV